MKILNYTRNWKRVLAGSEAIWAPTDIRELFVPAFAFRFRCNTAFRTLQAF